tara:strand:+ start:1931 stop:2092 length:162 start_codon:yes stop_codon:yes gene_type:complete
MTFIISCYFFNFKYIAANNVIIVNSNPNNEYAIQLPIKKNNVFQNSSNLYNIN